MEISFTLLIKVIMFIATAVLILLSMFFWINTTEFDTVNQISTNFSERIRYEGYIDRDMYEEYMTKISLSPYKIIFRHTKFKFNNLGQKVETTYTEKDILEKLYSPEGRYKFKKGDDFFVVVSQMQPAVYSVLMQTLTNSPAKAGVISTKGGMIENEAY